MKPQRLNIESEALEEFRQSLNAALEIVTCQLIRRKLQKGTVSAKVAITIHERADDKTGEIYYQMELEPNVNMKIGASDSLKCGTKAAIMIVEEYAAEHLDKSDPETEFETYRVEMQGAAELEVSAEYKPVRRDVLRTDIQRRQERMVSGRIQEVRESLHQSNGG